MTPRRAAAFLAAAFTLVLAGPAAAQGGGTTICHATGDPNTPYQQLEVSGGATLAHLDHPDDIVPAPAGGCPATALPPEPEEVVPELQETPTATPTPAPTATPDVVPPPSRRPARRPAKRPPAPAKRPSAPAGGPAAAGGVAGLTASGPGLRSVSASTETLPLTGGGPSSIALVGLGFLMAGAGVRLRYVGS